MKPEQGEQMSFLPAPKGQSWERTILLIPAIAAISLAILYAVGALLKAAQLRGAGLAISDTLPLLPLETILGAGIGVVVQSMLALVAYGLLFIGSRMAFRRVMDASTRRQANRKTELDALVQRVETLPNDKRKIEELERDVEQARQRAENMSRAVPAAAIAAGLLLLALLLLTDPVFAVASALTAIPLIFLIKGVELSKLIPYFLAGQYLLIVAAYVVSAFVYPSPLPQARVTIDGGGVAKGELVVATGSAWYLAGARNVEAIPLVRIERAEFESQDDPDPATVGTHLLRLLDEL